MTAEHLSAPRRGRPAVTTLAAIQAAALRVLDREGLSGLTVRGVARELGVAGPRLYTHIQDHEQLVTLAYEAAEAELDGLEWLDVDLVTDWRHGLRVFAAGLERHLRAHRGLVELSQRRRFFPTRGMAPALLERIALSAAAEGIDAQALADAVVDITTIVLSVVATQLRLEHAPRHDQLAHDIDHIAVEHPHAAALLARVAGSPPRNLPADLVEDVLRRFPV